MSSTQPLKGSPGCNPYIRSLSPSHHQSLLIKNKNKNKNKIRIASQYASSSYRIASSLEQYSQNMADTLSPAMAFASNDFYNPQATISLSDTSIQNSLMTPEPTSPESYYNVKEESVDGDESKKPTKKRKSWGQELPTPKTNLPPR